MGDDSTRSLSPGTGRAGYRQQLEPGDVLAGRFTIVQFIARGGMGEVYEASDQYFQNRHFALKTLREGIADDAILRQRFEREVLLSREVRHDNVCPSYDLFHAEGPRGPITFLTMKLLRGESLAARIGRGGPMSVEAALPLVRQMAEGLDAAHRAGIIHRDFKPGNVMLEGSGAETRAVITDFGLSRLYQADETLAETGHISGTLGYIAPELLEGRPATPASDVYSFGVVVYEMLTGSRPLAAPGRKAPAAPGALVEGVPRAWDRMVMGCLEPDPSRRFQTAGEALAALARTISTTRQIRANWRVSRRQWMETAVVVAAGLAMVGVVARPYLYRRLHPLPAQRFVALMAWPAESDPDRRALLKSTLDGVAARLHRAEARGSRDLMIISPGDVAGQAPPKAPAEAASALGANLVLAATLGSSAGRLTLSLKVLDLGRNTALRERTVTLAVQAAGRLPEKAAAAAAEVLDIDLPAGRLTDNEELARVSPAAFQAFSSAEELVAQANDSGLDQAIEKYQKALDLDPRFALGYARISMAYTRRFTRTQDPAALVLAAKNADQALRYNPDSAKAVLSRAIAYLYSGSTVQALDGIAGALRLDPENPQTLLYKALALRFLDRQAEEEEAYREIIRLRPNYWPAYNELGGVLHRHGKDREAAEAFAEASAVSPRATLPLTNLGAIYLLMGRKTEAAEAFHKSLERAPTELAYLQLGNLDFAAGEYRKALDSYVKARDLRPRNDVTWRNLGDCYAMLGDRARVLESYREAASLLAEALRTNPLRGSQWMTLAFYQAKLGRRDEAEAALKEAESRGATDLQSQFKKAQVLALEGRKDEALRLVLDCLDHGLSKMEVDLALDLAEVRADARYRNHQTQAPSGQSSINR